MIYNREVLISASGTKGDIFPLVGIALELKKRNIKVVFQANDFFRNFIEKEGISFVSLGSAEEYLAINADPRMWDPNENMEVVAAEYSKSSRDLAFKYVEQQHTSGKKLFIITNTVPNGVRLAAVKFSIPQAVVILAPYGLISTISPSAPYSWCIPRWLPPRFCFLYIQTINKLSEKFNWQPSRTNKIFNLYYKLGIFQSVNMAEINYPDADLLIGLFPKWFSSHPKDWPKRLQLVGFPLFDEVDTSTRSIVDRFIRTNGNPLLFTAGTGVHNVTSFFSEGRRVCELLNIPGVFVGGKIGTSLLDDSKLCLHVDYVDFEYVLPRCKAIIHHGGIGTSAQAIRAGIPQLIRPIKIDQPDNASRIKKLGLGDYIMPEDFYAETIIKLLNVMFTKPCGVLKKYSHLQKESDAIKNACNVIEHKIRQLNKCK